jgi:hypothetical protein
MRVAKRVRGVWRTVSISSSNAWVAGIKTVRRKRVEHLGQARRRAPQLGPLPGVFKADEITRKGTSCYGLRSRRCPARRKNELTTGAQSISQSDNSQCSAFYYWRLVSLHFYTIRSLQSKSLSNAAIPCCHNIRKATPGRVGFPLTFYRTAPKIRDPWLGRDFGNQA